MNLNITRLLHWFDRNGFDTRQRFTYDAPADEIAWMLDAIGELLAWAPQALDALPLDDAEYEYLAIRHGI